MLSGCKYSIENMIAYVVKYLSDSAARCGGMQLCKASCNRITA